MPDKSSPKMSVSSTEESQVQPDFATASTPQGAIPSTDGNRDAPTTPSQVEPSETISTTSPRLPNSPARPVQPPTTEEWIFSPTGVLLPSPEYPITLISEDLSSSDSEASVPAVTSSSDSGLQALPPIPASSMPGPFPRSAAVNAADGEAEKADKVKASDDQTELEGPDGPATSSRGARLARQTEEITRHCGTNVDDTSLTTDSIPDQLRKLKLAHQTEEITRHCGTNSHKSPASTRDLLNDTLNEDRVFTPHLGQDSVLITRPAQLARQSMEITRRCGTKTSRLDTPMRCNCWCHLHPTDRQTFGTQTGDDQHEQPSTDDVRPQQPCNPSPWQTAHRLDLSQDPYASSPEHRHTLARLPVMRGEEPRGTQDNAAMVERGARVAELRDQRGTTAEDEVSDHRPGLVSREDDGVAERSRASGPGGRADLGPEESWYISFPDPQSHYNNADAGGQESKDKVKAEDFEK